MSRKFLEHPVSAHINKMLCITIKTSW